MKKHRKLDNRPTFAGHTESFDILPLAKACLGKVKHPTYLSASATLKGLKPHKKPETLTIYHCPYCAKYHLGNLYKNNSK